MDNHQDPRGNPICPVCDQSILPAESVAKSHSYIVHLLCSVSRLYGINN
jgi:hypothetical protein